MYPLAISLIYFLLLVQAIPAVLGSPLAPPSSWKNPQILTTMDQRLSLTEAALDRTVAMLNSNGVFQLASHASFGAEGLAFLQMAEFDAITNQTRYRQVLKTAWAHLSPARPQLRDTYLNYALMHGYAAARAYATYNDSVFLQYAIDSWTFGQSYTLTKKNVAAGTIATKNFTLSTQCEGVTMAGGTYWSIVPSEPSLNVLSTGQFLVLSATLFELTGNNTYLDAANAAVSFVRAHLYNVNHIVQDSISSKKNDSCSVKSYLFSYNSGVVLEGLAILASATQSSDLKSFAFEVLNGVASNTNWIRSDGVISSWQFVRGLTAMYQRLDLNQNNTDYITALLSVQYNAVMDSNIASPNNTYSGSWTGSATSNWSLNNQTSSMNVLVGSLFVGDNNNNNNNGDSNNNNNGDSNKSGSPGPVGQANSIVGPIVGGVVGAVLLVIVLVVITIIFYRRRRRQRMEKYRVQDPFILSTKKTLPNIHIPFLRKEKQPVTPTSESSTTTAGQSLKRPPRAFQPQRTTRRTAATLPTEELVRMLNERLQPEQWDAQDLPPIYHSPPPQVV